MDIAVHGVGLGTGTLETDQQAGVDNGWSTGGGGGVTVEPFATDLLSVPVTLSGGGGERTTGGGTLRLGLRYRATHWLGLGTGVSGGMYGYDAGFEFSDFYGSCVLDFETLLGFERKWAALTFAVRPSFVFGIGMDDTEPDNLFFLPVDLTVGIFLVPGRFALTVHAGAGVFTGLERNPGWNAWAGAGGGFYIRL